MEKINNWKYFQKYIIYIIKNRFCLKNITKIICIIYKNNFLLQINKSNKFSFGILKPCYLKLTINTYEYYPKISLMFYRILLVKQMQNLMRDQSR